MVSVAKKNNLKQKYFLSDFSLFPINELFLSFDLIIHFISRTSNNKL